MNSPDTVDVDLEFLRRIQATLQMCAEDLTTLLEHEYPAALRSQYPAYERKYRNDMDVVKTALDCVEELKGLT